MLFSGGSIERDLKNRKESIKRKKRKKKTRRKRWGIAI
jgi:hypothetical protein